MCLSQAHMEAGPRQQWYKYGSTTASTALSMACMYLRTSGSATGASKTAAHKAAGHPQLTQAARNAPHDGSNRSRARGAATPSSCGLVDGRLFSFADGFQGPRWRRRACHVVSIRIHGVVWD